MRQMQGLPLVRFALLENMRHSQLRLLPVWFVLLVPLQLGAGPARHAIWATTRIPQALTHVSCVPLELSIQSLGCLPANCVLWVPILILIRKGPPPATPAYQARMRHPWASRTITARAALLAASLLALGRVHARSVQRGGTALSAAPPLLPIVQQGHTAQF